MIMKTQPFKIYGMPQKVLREKFIVIEFSSKEKKNTNQQLNLPHKRIRKITKKAHRQQKEGNLKDQRGHQ